MKRISVDRTTGARKRLLRWVRVVPIVVFLCACQSTLFAAAAQETPNPQTATGETGASSSSIRLASGEWVPYSGENLPNYGCDLQVISEAFAREGVTVEYGFFPWARAFYLANEGIWDGTPDWADTPEHRQAFYLSAEPVSAQELVFFYRIDRPFTWETLDDLVGKTVGLTSGYVYSDAFVDLQDKGTVNFEEASSDTINLRKLLVGRLDVFPLEKRVGIAILNTQFSAAERSQIRYVDKPLGQFSPYLLLSKTNPKNEQHIQQFDRGLARLKESGRYTEIMDNCSNRLE